jgi:hypothetical protein
MAAGLLVTGCTKPPTPQPAPTHPRPAHTFSVPKTPDQIRVTLADNFQRLVETANANQGQLPIPLSPDNYRAVPGVASCTNLNGKVYDFGDRVGYGLGADQILAVCLDAQKSGDLHTTVYFAPARYLRALTDANQLKDPFAHLALLLGAYLDYLQGYTLYQRTHPHTFTDRNRACYSGSLEAGLHQAGYLTSQQYGNEFRHNTTSGDAANRNAYKKGAAGKTDCLNVKV